MPDDRPPEENEEKTPAPGSYGYATGTEGGRVKVPGDCLNIRVQDAGGGGSFTINDGASIVVRAGAVFQISLEGVVRHPVLHFSGSLHYFVDWLHA